MAFTQYHPTVDITAGGWTKSTGGGTNLFSMVDELVSAPDNASAGGKDEEYILSSSAPSADVCELQFSAMQTAGTNTGHTISYRIRGDASTDLEVKLIAGDGSTVVKTWAHVAPGSWTTYDQTLSTDETDAWAAATYPGSRLRFTAGGSTYVLTDYWATGYAVGDA